MKKVKILIPVGDTKLMSMTKVCNMYGCKVKYQDKDRAYFEISSDDPLNFFWLGANLYNKLG